jgi:hypothetical protein
VKEELMAKLENGGARRISRREALVLSQIPLALAVV